MSTTPPTIEPEVWKPKYNPWLIAGVVALAAFMEVLDTSIANVALPYIGGSLGASLDQSTWVLTSYLVSNAIILPISGWLAGAVGRKRFFMICLTIFTASSLLCGFAPSLGLLLFFPSFLLGAGGPPPHVMGAAVRHIAGPLPLTLLTNAVRGPWLGLGPATGSLLGLAGLTVVCTAVAARRTVL